MAFDGPLYLNKKKRKKFHTKVVFLTMGQQSTNRTSTAINSGTTVTTSTSPLSSTVKVINMSTAQSLLSATAYVDGQLVAYQIPLSKFFIDAVLARLWTTMEKFRLGNKKLKM